jgi:hypothetical protein
MAIIVMLLGYAGRSEARVGLAGAEPLRRVLIQFYQQVFLNFSNF